MTVLITTVYKGSAVIQAIKAFNPSKVFFMVDKPLGDVRKNSIDMIMSFFTNIKFEQMAAEMYDIVAFASKTIEAINQISTEEEIVVHISEGRKTMSLGVLFGSYVKKNRVSSACYIVEETNEIVRIPIVEMKVSPKKQEVLKIISEGVQSVSALEKKLKITTATLYVHLKELKDDGLITKKNEITKIGKIVLLNNTN
jgi:CRISPR locus-related DNA-binding protein